MQNLEILAPAGGVDALDAALAAGANAVYFGLKHLNARRGAQNFLPEELPSLVEKVSAAGAKAYLTLNISLTQRELGLAIRTLAMAEQAGVDAVLVRDPALLAVRRFFPKLAFHFSTQAGVSSSAGVKAAKALGVERVVLARELTEAEIAAASAYDVETEVFAQGALCFSCSGFCLMSSWVGGRSGNRGMCASPCRVPWRADGGAWQPAMSMHDLCLVDHLQTLKRLGVTSLKIEGRLKSADWVRRAVTLYRHTIDGMEADWRTQAETLGTYTGRQLTDGYFVGDRHALTGESGRVASSCGMEPVESEEDANPAESDGTTAAAAVFQIRQDEKGGTLWSLRQGGALWESRIPVQRVANARRAVTVGEVAARLQGSLPAGRESRVAFADDGLEKLLLPRSIGNRLEDELKSWLRLQSKASDGRVRGLSVPEGALKSIAMEPCRLAANSRTLGMTADWRRCGVEDLAALTAASAASLLVECAPVSEAEAAAQLEQLTAHRSRIAALCLPSVIYESQLPYIKQLMTFGVVVEVNSWDGWQLARDAGVRLMAGPHFSIINARAAAFLGELGCECVTVSPEIDREQLEDLCAVATVPLALQVYGRLPLMVTRAELPDGFRPEGHPLLEDKRGTAVRPSREGGLTVLRSHIPLDWRNLRNPKVRVAHLVTDGRGGAASAGSLFNYDRRLR